MAATRLTHTWRSSRAVGLASSSQMKLSTVKVKCMSNAIGFNVENNNRFVGDHEERKQVLLLAKSASLAVAPIIKTSEGVLEVTALVAVVRTSLVITRTRSWRSVVQSFIEKAVIDCRFFTMFAVAGTLLGSVLCFLEGTFLVIESYFHSLSLHSENGRVMALLIESLDMFLVGTAMLVFGMGLHVMFVGSKSLKSKGMPLRSSNFFGMFYLKNVPSWVGKKSVTQAKSMIGFSLMLLLQVGVLEKFKSIPLVTGLDLACFAGAVFVSSAGLFILSKLNLDS